MPRNKLVPVATAWRFFVLGIEERPSVRRVAVNISREESRPANKGYPARSLGEVLTNIRVKTGLLTKRLQLPQAYTDPLLLSKQLKRGVWSGMWKGMSL